MDETLCSLMIAQGALTGCCSLESIDQLGAQGGMLQEGNRQLAALPCALDPLLEIVQLSEQKLGAGQLIGPTLFLSELSSKAEVTAGAACSPKNQMELAQAQPRGELQAWRCQLQREAKGNLEVILGDRVLFGFLADTGCLDMSLSLTAAITKLST